MVIRPQTISQNNTVFVWLDKNVNVRDRKCNYFRRRWLNDSAKDTHRTFDLREEFMRSVTFRVF